VYSYGIQMTKTTWRYGALSGLVDPLAVTNDRGEFRLGVTVKNASLVVKVTAPFLAPAQVGPVVSGPTVHEVKLLAGATVLGRVIKDGKPVPGVTLTLRTVRLHQRFEQEYDFTIATDARGDFLFSNVPPERDYFLLAMMRDCHVHGAIPAQHVRVKANRTTENLDAVAIQPGHRVSGLLVLSDGKSVPPGARVYLGMHHEAVGLIEGLFVPVGEDGRFTATGLPSGPYNLKVMVTGYHLSSKNRSLDTVLEQYNQLTGRVDGNLEGLRLLLEPGPIDEKFDFYKLPAEEQRKRSKHYQERRNLPLEGVLTTVPGP
jgi:hypothetical protein